MIPLPCRHMYNLTDGMKHDELDIALPITEGKYDTESGNISFNVVTACSDSSSGLTRQTVPVCGRKQPIPSHCVGLMAAQAGQAVPHGSPGRNQKGTDSGKAFTSTASKIQSAIMPAKARTMTVFKGRMDLLHGLLSGTWMSSRVNSHGAAVDASCSKSGNFELRLLIGKSLCGTKAPEAVTDHSSASSISPEAALVSMLSEASD